MSSSRVHEDLGRKEKVTMGSDRTFGLVVGAAIAIFALVPLIHGGGVRLWLLGPAVIVLAVAVTAPRFLAPFNLVWFWVGKILSLIVSPVVMTVLFFVTITPVGIAVRWSGKDLLHLRRRRDVSTYWIERVRSSAARDSLKNQF
jgi:type IV secretory pathway TrbD component